MWPRIVPPPASTAAHPRWEDSLFARYQHTDFQSNQPQSSYTVEEAQAGIRLRH